MMYLETGNPFWKKTQMPSSRRIQMMLIVSGYSIFPSSLFCTVDPLLRFSPIFHHVSPLFHQVSLIFPHFHIFSQFVQPFSIAFPWFFPSTGPQKPPASPPAAAARPPAARPPAARPGRRPVVRRGEDLREREVGMTTH